MKELVKAIYNTLPFKKEIFSALKTVWKPSESVFKHLHFKGVISVPLSKTKSFKMNHYGFQLENDIFWTGLTEGWEKESIQSWMKLCESAETVFDIGANTGIYSLITKTVNPKATVYAFEPVSRVFKRLNENIKLNNFDIKPVEEAISNSNGTATIFDTTSEHTYSVTVNKNRLLANEEVVETQIKTITLDSFIKQHNIKKIDLMKIDVETHEPEVLEGFSEYIRIFKPSILIEILDEETGGKVDKHVQGFGYLFFNINEKTGIRQVDKITKSDDYNFLICTPENAAKLGLLKGNNR